MHRAFILRFAVQHGQGRTIPPSRFVLPALGGLFCLLAFGAGCSRTEPVEAPPPPPATPAAEATAAHPPGMPQWTNFETGANVKTLAFDHEQLWMGFPSGVIRYDTNSKDSYEVFTTESTAGGLLSRGIYVVRVDQEGNKWIGTYGGGLTRFDGKEWKTYSEEDGLADQWVYDIVWDRQGRMWVATWDGVSIFDGKTFKTYREKDGLADKWVYSIALDRNDIFWFGTESGVSRFDPKLSGRAAWKTLTHKDGLGADMGVPPMQMPGGDESSDTALSGGTEDYGDEAPSEYGAEGLRHHMDPSKANVGLNPDFVLAAVVDRDNAKWFGTWGAGLSRFDGHTWKTYTDKDGLGGNFIHALALDADGNVWAGTNGGVSWFDGNRWSNLSKREGLLDDNVFSIAFDDKGRRWFGTWQGLSMHQGPLPLSARR